MVVSLRLVITKFIGPFKMAGKKGCFESLEAPDIANENANARWNQGWAASRYKCVVIVFQKYIIYLYFCIAIQYFNCILYFCIEIHFRVYSCYRDTIRADKFP